MKIVFKTGTHTWRGVRKCMGCGQEKIIWARNKCINCYRKEMYYSLPIDQRGRHRPKGLKRGRRSVAQMNAGQYCTDCEVLLSNHYARSSYWNEMNARHGDTNLCEGCWRRRNGILDIQEEEPLGFVPSEKDKARMINPKKESSPAN